jgi:hypothetical protein
VAIRGDGGAIGRDGLWWRMIRGSCLCRGVTFEVKGPVRLLGNCHCSRCRKAYGSAFGTIAVVNTSDFAFTKGVDLMRSYAGGRVDRPFCANCGSRLPICVAGDPLVGIPAGLLDDDPGVRPSEDVFVDSKAPWWELGTGTERHAAWPPGFEPNPPWDPARLGE